MKQKLVTDVPQHPVILTMPTETIIVMEIEPALVGDGAKESQEESQEESQDDPE
jgi:hypothetical protein